MKGTLFLLAKQAGYELTPEYRFAPPRRFRIDLALVGQRIGLECDGGVWTGGRHVRPTGYLRDKEKLNLAASMGWLMFSFQPGKELEVWPLVERALAIQEEGRNRSRDGGEDGD